MGDWREIMGVSAKPTHYPQKSSTEGDFEDIEDTKPKPDGATPPGAVTVIEATFKDASASRTTINAPEFPPCPRCGQSRYWLASGGRVLCGTKQCASALRFQLIALKFHPVN